MHVHIIFNVFMQKTANINNTFFLSWFMVIIICIAGSYNLLGGIMKMHDF